MINWSIRNINWNVPTLISHMQKFTIQNKQKIQQRNVIFDNNGLNGVQMTIEKFFNVNFNVKKIFIYSCTVELWLFMSFF